MQGVVEHIEELMCLPNPELDDTLRHLELQRRALDAQMAAAVAVADARHVYVDDGHRSMQPYLRATCNWSNAETSRMRSLARLVNRHPPVGDALASGRIGRPQAFELARLHGNLRVAHRFADSLPALLDAAEQCSFDDFRIVAQRFTLLADPDGTHRDFDEAVEGRTARVVDVGGTLDVKMTGGDPLVTAEVLSIFDRFTNAEFHADLAAQRSEHGDDADSRELPRTGSQRRHDAMIAIFRAAEASTSERSDDQPLVNIVIDAHTFGRMLCNSGLSTATNTAGELVDPFTGLADNDDLLADLVAEPDLESLRCHTTNGVSLHPHQVLRAALAGHVRRVVVDSAGVVIDQGRKQRLFTGSARHAAMVLVQHCEHPGCDLPADWCDVDHAHEWEDGGGTDQTNARVRCASHNRHKHHHKLTSKRATNGRTYTIGNNGTIMLPVGARTPTFPDDHDEADEAAELVRTTQAARTRAAMLRPSG